jgi:hypothetical protein
VSRRVAAVAVTLLATVGSGACSKKSEGPSGPAPELTGLATVPADADIVMVIDVAKVAQSPIIDRAIEQMLSRDQALAAGWQKVADGCKIDVPKQVKFITLVLGPTPPGKHVGEGPLLLVATGNLPEHDLAECVGKMVGTGAGSVSGKTVQGRTLYQVKDGNRVMHFAYGRPDTVVMGASDAYVLEALGIGPKAPSQPELAAWMKLTDQFAPVWFVGRIDDRLKQRLVGVTDKQIKAGASAFVGAVDLTSGAKLDIGVIMADQSDAKALESWTNNQKRAIEMAAQAKAMGQVVHKVAITAEANIVRLRANLNMDDVNHVLSVLDPQPAPAQSPSPPAGAGSGSASPP